MKDTKVAELLKQAYAGSRRANPGAGRELTPTRSTEMNQQSLSRNSLRLLLLVLLGRRPSQLEMIP
jgi:hypothetical protein